MIRFLFKGVIRDRSRTMFPVLVISTGVALMVILHAWVGGAISDMVRMNANFQTGHVKIMTSAYAELAYQSPNDLALMGVDTLLSVTANTFPDFIWTPRIRFGGLLDIPDEAGETRSQGPAFGMGVALLAPGSPESEILNLRDAIVQGRMPETPGDILISEDFAQSLNIDTGQTATLISSTMYGSMATYNFRVAGTIRFGIAAMDRGAIIADIRDIQQALDMENGAGELVGFFDDFYYDEEKARTVVQTFNARYRNPEDEFSPLMISLRNQNGLGEMLDIASGRIQIVVWIFAGMMFIILWNAGLMGSLRRYGEIGVRLAIGEDKGHIFRAMLTESMIISLIGSSLGTLLGLAVSYYLQFTGFDIGYMMKNSSMMISNVLRAQVTPTSYVIGFFPGVCATLLGTAFSGIGIYKRQTSQLFKELEA